MKKKQQDSVEIPFECKAPTALHSHWLGDCVCWHFSLRPESLDAYRFSLSPAKPFAAINVSIFPMHTTAAFWVNWPVVRHSISVLRAYTVQSLNILCVSLAVARKNYCSILDWLAQWLLISIPKSDVLNGATLAADRYSQAHCQIVFALWFDAKTYLTCL